MSRTTRIRGVVFDLDGTLVDSMPLVLRAFAHALRPDCGELTEPEIIARLGGPPDRTLRSFIPTEERVAVAMQRLVDYNALHQELIRPYDGAHDLLDELRRIPQLVGVWTGRERESTGWILARHGLGEKLDTCVCGDDLPTHKPDPEGLQQALRQMKVKQEDALFVGDADVDVLAGHACGVRTVLIAHDRQVRSEVKSKAWRSVVTPGEAYALLREELAAGH